MSVDWWWRWRESDVEAEPFPAKLAWVLENPVARALARPVLRYLDLKPGMRVLDVGAGPGRVALTAAERVGPEGEVVAVDVQPEMLEKLRRHAEAKDLTNVRTVVGGAGQGVVEGREHFDRAALVSVIGEISPELREDALREIHGALKPGGLLVVAEEFSDPHYKSPETVRRLGEGAGFQVSANPRGVFGHTMLLEKPPS